MTPSAKLTNISSVAPEGGSTQVDVLSDLNLVGTPAPVYRINGVPFVTVPGGSNAQIQFNNNGALGASNNLVWDNTNARMGIGTNLPSARLHLAGLSADPVLGDATASVSILTDVSSGYQIRTGFYVSAPYPAWIQAANTGGAAVWPLVINPLGGNVGIGTQNPQVALDVAGNVNITDPGGASGYAFRVNGVPIGGGGGGSQWTDVTSVGIYYNGGKVGIGVTNPVAVLHIAGTSADPVLSDPTTCISILAEAGAGSGYQIRTGYLVSPPYAAWIQAAVTNAGTTWPLALNPLGGDVSIGGNFIASNLPSADPGAGSKQFWYDPGDGNRVKYSA